MSGFRNVSQYVAAERAGQRVTGHFRKVPSQTTVAGWWYDFSMASGNPPPNYYASEPLVAATLDGMTKGLFRGSDLGASYQKHLAAWSLCSPTAGMVGRYTLMDYLIYYPFIDLDDGDAQVLDNTVTLPRYEDGEGVRAMLVAAAPTTGSGQFTYDYVNQDGDSKTSPTQFCSTAVANIGSIITSEQGVAAGGRPFLTLASGDTGIRSITGFTNSVLNGGLGSLVLVKPLADHAVFEIGIESEKRFYEKSATSPRIYDGAYLNMILDCAATVAAGTLSGRLEYIWG